MVSDTPLDGRTSVFYNGTARATIEGLLPDTIHMQDRGK